MNRKPSLAGSMSEYANLSHHEFIFEMIRLIISRYDVNIDDAVVESAVELIGIFLITY